MKNLGFAILEAVSAYIGTLEQIIIELEFDQDAGLNSNGYHSDNHWESVINQWSKCLNY